jgi:hypothetical protein
VRAFIAAFHQKGELTRLFRAATGGGGEEKKKALALFGRLPELTPATLVDPTTLVATGLWEAKHGPKNWGTWLNTNSRPRAPRSDPPKNYGRKIMVDTLLSK